MGATTGRAADAPCRAAAGFYPRPEGDSDERWQWPGALPVAAVSVARGGGRLSEMRVSGSLVPEGEAEEREGRGCEGPP